LALALTAAQRFELLLGFKACPGLIEGLPACGRAGCGVWRCAAL